MNRIKILFLFLSITLLANDSLKNNYFIDNHSVLLSDIVKNPIKDQTLFSLAQNKHSKRVKSRELLQLLNTLGYPNFQSKHAYVQFTQKSPISTTKIRDSLKNSYENYYEDISIENINIAPRSYISAIPKKYEIVINKKDILKNRGTLYIKTMDHKKIFFNYTIKARVSVVVARMDIKRGGEISRLNSKKKSIILDNFRATPLQKVKSSNYQAKVKIKASKIITQRDLVGLNLIRRGETVNITVSDSNIAISFSAKALRSGKYGDTITVVNKNGKKLKVLVTGRNIAEMR